MSDVVIRLPVRNGEEATLFGDFLNRFLHSCSAAAERWADNDAPYVMVHSDPQADLDLKVLTFQEKGAAQDFRTGWAAAASALNGVQAAV